MRYQRSTFKMADPAGTETVEEEKERTKNTPTQPEREHPAIEVSPNCRVVPSPSEDVPATSRTRRMAQEMKKLRSLHTLHVPASRSKTS